jgi:hypothetical protein
MNFRIGSLLFGLLCVGCSAKHMPISYNCPKIELPSDPIDYTKILTDVSSPDEVIKAWVTTASGYKEWNAIVREQMSKQ